MRRRVITTAKYHGKAKDIFLEALEFRELTEAMSGIAEYDGLTDKVVQQSQTYLVDVTIFKVFKTKGYEMFIEYLDANACVLQSREKGGVIKMWDHKLTVRQDSEFAIWVDDVTIDAGLTTIAMAHFGAFVYKQRHKHRKALSITTQVKSITS